MIHDKTHGMALVYKPYEYHIIPMEGFEMASPDGEEARYRALWQEFYDAIAIPGRYNPRCRMSHMPKRYWEHMTEFQKPANNETLGREVAVVKKETGPSSEQKLAVQ